LMAGNEGLAGEFEKAKRAHVQVSRMLRASLHNIVLEKKGVATELSALQAAKADLSNEMEEARQAHSLVVQELKQQLDQAEAEVEAKHEQLGGKEEDLLETRQSLVKMREELKGAEAHHEEVGAQIEAKLEATLRSAEEMAAKGGEGDEHLAAARDAMRAAVTEAKEQHALVADGMSTELATMTGMDALQRVLETAKEAHLAVTKGLETKLEDVEKNAESLREKVLQQQAAAKEASEKKEELEHALANSEMQHKEVETTMKKSLEIAYEQMDKQIKEIECNDLMKDQILRDRDQAMQSLEYAQAMHDRVTGHLKELLAHSQEETAQAVAQLNEAQHSAEALGTMKAEMEHAMAGADKRHAQVVMMLRASLHESMTKASVAEFEKDQIAAKDAASEQHRVAELARMEAATEQYKKEKEEMEHECESWHHLEPIAMREHHSLVESLAENVGEGGLVKVKAHLQKEKKRRLKLEAEVKDLRAQMSGMSLKASTVDQMMDPLRADKQRQSASRVRVAAEIEAEARAAKQREADSRPVGQDVGRIPQCTPSRDTWNRPGPSPSPPPVPLQAAFPMSSPVEDVLAAVEGPPEQACEPHTLHDLFDFYTQGAGVMSFEVYRRFAEEYELLPGYVSQAKAEQLFVLACDSTRWCGPEEFAMCTQMCLASVMEVLDDDAEVPAGIASLAGLALNEEEGTPLQEATPPAPSPDFFPQQSRNTPPSRSPPSHSSYSALPTYSNGPAPLYNPPAPAYDPPAPAYSAPTYTAPARALSGDPVDSELEWLKGQILSKTAHTAPPARAPARAPQRTTPGQTAPRQRPADMQRGAYTMRSSYGRRM